MLKYIMAAGILCTLLTATAAFGATAIKVINPTTAHPKSVGKYDSPGRTSIDLNVFSNGARLGGLRKSAFTTQINGQDAPVLFCVEHADYYTLIVQPAAAGAPTLADLRVNVLGTTVTVAGAEQFASTDTQPTDVMLTLDVSGSMEEDDKLPAAISAGQFFVDQMKLGDSVGIATFSDSAYLNMPLTPLDSGASLPLYDQQFEINGGGWSGTGGWAWTSVNGTHNGWTDSPGGNYANNVNISLISPPISLPGAKFPELQIVHKYDINDVDYDENNDNDYYEDYIGYYATVDDGKSWLPLGFYTGQQSTFTTDTLLMNDFGGHTVRIGISLVTNSVGGADGYYLDRITILNPNTADAAKTTLAGLETIGGTGIGGGLETALHQFSGQGANGSVACWTDSPHGDYQDDVKQSLLSKTIDLTGLAAPHLKFQTHYAIEEGYDYGRVYVVDNGTRTKIAEYTGEQPDWTPIDLNLSAWKGKTIQLDFVIESDDEETEDGWYLDNFWVGDKDTLQTVFEDDAESSHGLWTPTFPWNLYGTQANSTHAWAIILLTDGYENVEPYVADVLPSLVASPLDVYTIALGADADQQLLGQVASATGGSFYVAPSGNDLTHLYDLISGVVNNNEPVAAPSGTLAPGASADQTVLVDPSLESIIFSLSWNGAGNDLDLTLRDPDGHAISHSTQQSGISFASGTTSERYTIQNPTAGNWTATVHAVTVVTTESTIAKSLGYVKRDPSQKVVTYKGDLVPALVSKTEPGKAESPKVLRASYNLFVTGRTQVRMNTSFFDKLNYTSTPLRMFVALGDPNPILHATMIGTVTTPLGHVVPLVFNDVNQQGDVITDDGIFYTLEYNVADGPGTYSFIVDASGQSNSNQEFTRVALTSTYVQNGFAPRNGAQLWQLYE